MHQPRFAVNSAREIVPPVSGISRGLDGIVRGMVYCVRAQYPSVPNEEVIAIRPVLV